MIDHFYTYFGILYTIQYFNSPHKSKEQKYIVFFQHDKSNPTDLLFTAQFRHIKTIRRTYPYSSTFF